MNDKMKELLKVAKLKRELLFRSTNAARLVNGAGDGMAGLVLEQYDRHFVSQVFDPRWFGQKAALIDFVKNECGGQYFIVKDRARSQAAQPDAFTASIWIEGTSSQTIVEENGLQFSVDLNDTLNTGLFLDMRENRRLAASMAGGKKVLNCFAYTCSFGVYCRREAAASVVNVDISKKNLERGRVNYELNRIVAAPNEFIREDAAQYLRRAGKKDNRFDLIILDPPSFSRHEGKTFSVRKNMPGLLAAALAILNPAGRLFAATNYSGMTVADLENLAREAAQTMGVKIVSLKHCGPDIDFPAERADRATSLSAVCLQINY
ncbi:MAG: class I SAM-dependent rRNA methyltransferase [Candidatus Omnitrophica bacterium]|nr:class I SAM-dependent rRNA methyltransferase [Candidatus Omnitrophota bacterium]